MKFKKKPIVIEAFRYDGEVTDKKGEYLVPRWAVRALQDRTMYFDNDILHIKTPAGTLHVCIGDYVIRGVQGELYPCKPDIFNETYEKV